MVKVIRVDMPSDGTAWEIPAKVVAKDRAGYYAKKDSVDELGNVDQGEYDRTFREEMDLMMSDNFELFDWARNNMNWSDVKDHAVQIMTPPPAPDYDGDWANASMLVIERPE